MSEEMFIGFGKDDGKLVSGGRSEKYKGKKNQTDRIAFVWVYRDANGNPCLGEKDTPKFKMVNYHYVPSLGYIMAKGDFTTQRFGPPKRRIGTFVLKYKTDRQGTLLKDANGSPQIDFDILEWQLGEDKYRLLASIHEEFPLCGHDLKVTCTDEQFQKLSFAPCAGQAIWQRNEAVRNRVLERVAEMERFMSLCRDMSIEEIKQKLNEAEGNAASGDGASGAGGSTASSINYDDFMDDL